MIVGSEDRKETSVIHMNTTSSMPSLSTNTGVTTSSLAAVEPSGSFLDNEAISPISEDSVPSPEGTPEGLVLEKDDEKGNTLSVQPDMLQESQMSMLDVIATTDTPQAIVQTSQFAGRDQFVGLTGHDNWSMAASMAPMQIVQTPMVNMSEIPPPPMVQSFSGVSTANLNFDPAVQGFIRDEGNLGPSFTQVQQGSSLIEQFQMGAGGMGMPQQNIQMQLQTSDSVNHLSIGASTTPTQDESAEPTVRPIDILTQLLNKGRKSKKDRQPSTEKDRTHSDHDKEHRSKDHGKHKKSSRRKSSDRHHSSEFKESSSDRSDSWHSSSKRSHHRRKSRGHSKEKHSSYSEEKVDRREGSIDNYDDSSLDSYLKSPKILRLQSSESLGDSEEGKARLGHGDSVDESTLSMGSDAVEIRPVTIFDQRRNDNQVKKDKASVNDEELPQDFGNASSKQSLEASQVSSLENKEILPDQKQASNMELFIKQQDSFEGQVSSTLNDFQPSEPSLNPSVSLPNTDHWTLPTSKPQEQMEFYFDSRRSPTPEMDHFNADLPISQPQQPHLIPSHFQQVGSFAPSSLPQFDSQSTVLFSEANVAPQVSMPMGPTVSMEQTGSFPQGIPMQPVGDHSIQQQNIPVGGFQAQPMFNQQPVLQTEQPFLHETGMSSNETMVVANQQGNMMLSGVDPRFRLQPPVSSMHFGTPDNNLQRSIVPPLQPPQLPFQQERPFFRGDGPVLHQERPFFQQMRPNIRHGMPPVFNDHANFGHEENPPFVGTQDGFENHGDEFRHNFNTQRSSDEIQHGEGIGTMQRNNNEISEGNSNFGQDNQHSLSSESPAVRDSPHVFRDFNAHQENLSKDPLHPSSTFENRDDMHQNDPFQRKTDEINGHYNHFEREPMRPRFPQPNMPMRNRFRPPGPNLAMRGPRPHRMFRSSGYQHQRPRFRPPMPRARIPQGYMPRRPVF